jgi:hypothetical protein
VAAHLGPAGWVSWAAEVESLMPDARLQRTREAYEDLPVQALTAVDCALKVHKLDYDTNTDAYVCRICGFSIPMSEVFGR